MVFISHHSLTLLTLSSVIVDKLATTVLANRTLYSAFKFEDTVDFSDAKELGLTEALRRQASSKFRQFVV